jgi:hypothetical protein
MGGALSRDTGARAGFLAMGRIGSYPPVAMGAADLDPDPDPVIEVVDELYFESLVDEGFTGGDSAEDERPTSDPYDGFVGAMTEVALSFGAAPEGVMKLRAMLGTTRIDGVVTDPGAMAWQGIIRGESDDYSGCGTQTFDEWAASMVAAIARSGRPEAIRLELRRHGVAAFGLMASAL